MWRCLRTVLLAGFLFPLPASAQEEPAPSDPWANSPESNDFSSVGVESAELRALRMAELELFGAERALLDVEDAFAVHIGEPPDALTSLSPAPRPEAAAGESDLAWLRGLSLPDVPVRWDDKVVRYLEFYRDDPRGRSIIGAWLRRAGRYGPLVRRRLRAMELPEDLLFVAMIESGFDPQARSHAGAVGMWQFVRDTGVEYGLRVDHWVDERMDPERSTEAGASYLRDLYRRFGSWELAFAAYNMGYGALLRAIRKYNTNDYWVLARLEAGLPFETTFYVAKVMACAIVGRNPERFGFDESSSEAALAFEEVQAPAGAPLSRIARAAGTTPEELRSLNPALRRGRIPPGGEALSIRIPDGSREAFLRALSRLHPRHPAQRPYVVRFGETLEQVARRFRTTRAALRSLNELPDGARVGAGFRLVVPAVEPREEPGSTAEERVVISVAEQISYPGRRRVFYRVTEGDTADEVARFFRVSGDDLRRWNQVSPSATLQRGMVLQLFVPAEVDLSRAVVLAEDDVRVLVVGTEEFFDYHEAQRGRVRFRYTVRPGDTLTSIGRRFDLSVGSLARINRFERRTLLRSGQQIIVYTPRDTAPAAVTREFDARVAATAQHQGAVPPAPAPPLRDDGDGELDAADTPTPAPAPEPVEAAPDSSAIPP